MRGSKGRSALIFVGVALPLAVALSGCSLVKRQELEDQLSSLQAQMREEMAQGDQQTAETLTGQIDGVEGSLNARMDGLERDLAAIEADFQAQVEELESALHFDVPVFFGFDEADVRQSDFPVLERFAQVVNKYYPTSMVTVEGFTDPAGSPEYNLQLGKRRAEAVVSYLVGQAGLSSERIRAVSYGEAQDRIIASGGHGPGEAGWQNRRVALVIDYSGS